MSDAVVRSIDDGVMVLRIDDGKANVVSFELVEAVTAALDAAAADDEVRAIAILGRDGTFSGGFDLGVMRSGDAEAMSRLVADGGELIRAMFAAPVPIVIGANGHALAAGALLLLAADVRIGADGPFRVGLPEVAIGMGLPRWAHRICEARLSRRHGLRAVSTGRITDPSTAVDVGFLDEVVASEDVEARTLEVAAELAATVHPGAYRSIVRLGRGEVLDAMAEAIALEREIGPGAPA